MFVEQQSGGVSELDCWIHIMQSFNKRKVKDLTNMKYESTLLHFIQFIFHLEFEMVLFKNLSVSKFLRKVRYLSRLYCFLEYIQVRICLYRSHLFSTMLVCMCHNLVYETLSCKPCRADTPCF